MTKRMFSMVCFEGEGTVNTGDTGNTVNTGSQQSFNQDDLNRFLAEDRRKHQAKYEQLEASYKNILASKGLAEDERGKLKLELEDLQKTHRTREQQLEFDKKQAVLKYESDLTEWKQKATTWEGMYKTQVIDTSLQNAAVGGDAFNPNQIVSLLRPITELRPEVDKEGKETGRLVPMIDFPDVDEKTGEPIKTLRTPTDAVKRMRELPTVYGNLFKANVVSGVGAGSAAGGVVPSANGKLDVANMTQEQYMKIRAEHPELLGLKRKPR